MRVVTSSEASRDRLGQSLRLATETQGSDIWCSPKVKRFSSSSDSLHPLPGLAAGHRDPPDATPTLLEVKAALLVAC